MCWEVCASLEVSAASRSLPSAGLTTPAACQQKTLKNVNTPIKKQQMQNRKHLLFTMQVIYSAFKVPHTFHTYVTKFVLPCLINVIIKKNLNVFLVYQVKHFDLVYLDILK